MHDKIQNKRRLCTMRRLPSLWDTMLLVFITSKQCPRKTQKSDLKWDGNSIITAKKRKEKKSRKHGEHDQTSADSVHQASSRDAKNAAFPSGCGLVQHTQARTRTHQSMDTRTHARTNYLGWPQARPRALGRFTACKGCIRQLTPYPFPWPAVTSSPPSSALGRTVSR